MPADERDRIAHAVGIGAVKYADLSKHRTNDYVFDWEQMLSFDGNTAPYLQYACARIRSLFRRAEGSSESAGLNPQHAAERQLVMQLLRFQEVVEQVSDEGLPHFLCGYLYDLATRFSQFYEQCPILTAPADDRARRLAYCRRTLTTLEQGLELLGIEVPQRM